ncbi:MAG: hypothetical protein J6X44_07835, partial [Thermoguttaceae bacterium]|nr:hypothetical protein [Thermoguttaceae bacterium]
MDQLTKSKENSAFYRCAPLVVALCLIMVAGCCSTSNRPKFLQRLQNREEVDSRVNDSQKDSPSRSSDPLKEKETVGSRSLTAQSDSGDRSQYVDNAAAKDTSNAGSNQAINAPYRSYAPSVDQADRQPTLNEYQIPDPTPLSTQGIPQTAQTIEASQTQPASEPTPEPAPVASEPQESAPAPEPEPTPEPKSSEPEASSVPTPPVVSEPEPAPTPQPKEPESSVPTPPTTFEPASVKTEQSAAQDQVDAEPQASEQVENVAPEPTGLQGDSTVGDLVKEATGNAETGENPEPVVPSETPAPAAEAASGESPASEAA